MKPMKKRLLSLLLTLVTILSLLPTSAFAASKTGSGIQITQDQAYWSTRLLANGTPYSYRPPLADGKLVYCMDSGLGYHYATKSFLDSYSWTSGSGADADAVLQSALTNSGLSEMDAMTVLLTDNGYFLLPGGTPISAQLQFARTVARRAERRLWTLHRQDPVNEDILRFINRLSDLFFVMARMEMQRQDWPEEKWQEFAYKRKRQ